MHANSKTLRIKIEVIDYPKGQQLEGSRWVLVDENISHDIDRLRREVEFEARQIFNDLEAKISG